PVHPSQEPLHASGGLVHRCQVNRICPVPVGILAAWQRLVDELFQRERVPAQAFLTPPLPAEFQKAKVDEPYQVGPQRHSLRGIVTLYPWAQQQKYGVLYQVVEFRSTAVGALAQRSQAMTHPGEQTFRQGLPRLPRLRLFGHFGQSLFAQADHLHTRAVACYLHGCTSSDVGGRKRRWRSDRRSRGDLP